MTTLRAGTALGVGLAITGLNLRSFWFEYFALGGSHTQVELLDYLSGRSAWSTTEHDTAVHVINECCTSMGLEYLADYAPNAEPDLWHDNPHPGNPPLNRPLAREVNPPRKSPDVADPQERQQRDDRLHQDATALRLLSRELAQDLSESAARIAQTADEIARIHEVIAVNGVSPCAPHALEHADRARRLAQHERAEQHRWSQEALHD